MGDPRREKAPAKVLLYAKVPFSLLVSPTGYDVVPIGVDRLATLHGAQSTAAVSGDQWDPQMPFQEGPVGSMFYGEP